MRTDEPAERGRVKRRAGLKAAIVGGKVRRGAHGGAAPEVRGEE